MLRRAPHGAASEQEGLDVLPVTIRPLAALTPGRPVYNEDARLSPILRLNPRTERGLFLALFLFCVLTREAHYRRASFCRVKGFIVLLRGTISLDVIFPGFCFCFAVRFLALVLPDLAGSFRIEMEQKSMFFKKNGCRRFHALCWSPWPFCCRVLRVG